MVLICTPVCPMRSYNPFEIEHSSIAHYNIHWYEWSVGDLEPTANQTTQYAEPDGWRGKDHIAEACSTPKSPPIQGPENIFIEHIQLPCTRPVDLQNTVDNNPWPHSY